MSSTTQRNHSASAVLRQRKPHNNRKMPNRFQHDKTGDERIRITVLAGFKKKLTDPACSDDGVLSNPIEHRSTSEVLSRQMKPH